MQPSNKQTNKHNGRYSLPRIVILVGLFKTLIAGALNDMASLTDGEKHDVLSTIDQTMVAFFTQVMQWMVSPAPSTSLSFIAPFNLYPLWVLTSAMKSRLQ